MFGYGLSFFLLTESHFWFLHSFKTLPINLIWQMQVSTTVCSMIAFVSNRLVNGLQLENVVAFLAGGVSERISHYLHAIGLSSSRRSAIRAINHLSKLGLAILKKKASRDYILRPFLVLDNFDIQERIHYSRLEQESRMFHGTYGYMHFLLKDLLANENVDPRHLTLESLVTAMREAESKSVGVKDLIPSVPERARWKETIKAQLSQGYQDYITTNNQTMIPQIFLKLSRHSSPVEPLVLETPELLMLPLMDLSCGSAVGVGQVLERVGNLTGQPVKDFPDDLQVIEGDVGTCINLESHRAKLQPAGNKHESMANYLTIPGGAHTM